MKLGIMQPYFFPYIGYFQLMNAVDKFVVYDDIKYTKKGWINRNRILSNGKDYLFSLPLKKDSDYLDICQRKLADCLKTDVQKILKRIEASYSKAPYYNEAFLVIEDCFLHEADNLFDFTYYSLEKIKDYLNIKTEISVSSKLGLRERLKGEKRVLSICKHLNATQYINAIGGVKLYNKEIFLKEKIKLNFIKSDIIEYEQFENDFVPWLSIIDVMMFNQKEKIKKMLDSHTLI